MLAALTPPLVSSPKAPGATWPADGNAGFLRDDARLALLAVPLTSFELSAVPRDPSQIAVTIDGAPTTNFRYDAASNRIVSPRT